MDAAGTPKSDMLESKPDKLAAITERPATAAYSDSIAELVGACRLAHHRSTLRDPAYGDRRLAFAARRSASRSSFAPNHTWKSQIVPEATERTQ